jgi:hypothetical protein
MAIYHPARRGLPMTFAYTRPLARVLGTPRTARFATEDRLMVSPLRPLVRLALAVRGFFKG